MSSNLSGTMFALFVVAMAGAAAMLFTGVGLVESGSYYPEDVVIVEGHIVRYAPYFRGNRHRKDRHIEKAHTQAASAQSMGNQFLGSEIGPLGVMHFHVPSGPQLREGIGVTIEFIDDKGKQCSIDETWLLPWIGQFGLGSSVPVVWCKARPIPESVVKAEPVLNTSVNWANHTSTPKDAPELRARNLKKLEQILTEYASHYERVDRYKRAYNDPEIDDWTFDEEQGTWTE